MSVNVSIHDGPLPPAAAPQAQGAGATVTFEGIVRPLEDGRPLVALDYEAYRPMADSALQSLGSELLAAHGLLSVTVQHSRGRVPTGACSFRLIICGLHRKESLAAMDEFIDRMKRDVPIWKRPAWVESSQVDPKG